MTTSPSAAATFRVVDAHTHFYDPSRPGGITWPSRTDNQLFRPLLPPDYRTCAVPRPVAGVIAIETSDRLEDTRWLLALAATDPFVLSVVGNLPVGTPEFARQLDLLGPLGRLCGVRLPRVRLGHALSGKGLHDLRLLASLGLTLDVYGGPALLPDLIRLASLVTGLSIVIDHAAYVPNDEQLSAAEWAKGLRAAAAAPNVFCKVSAFVESTGLRDRSAPSELQFYRPVLDVLWNAFGPERLIYGSNWPVCELFAPLETVQQIATEYVVSHGGAAALGVLGGNAERIYGCRSRR